MNKSITALLAFILLSCHQPKKYSNPHILINTTFGQIEVELFPKQAPKTVAAFLTYVDADYFKPSSFYRVLSNENVPSEYNAGLIQGGIFKTNSAQLATMPGIVHEGTSQTGLRHTSGTISLAKTTPGTASTEFFICIGDQLQFDSDSSKTIGGEGFAVFGRVYQGMGIVRQIQNEPSLGENFKQDIQIKSIERLQ